MHMAVTNPFWFGESVGPLTGRDADVAAAIDALTNAGRLLLTGWRHFGKSSILCAACAEVTARGVAVLRYDAEAFESLEALAREMASGATRTFATSLDHAGDIARRFFAALGARRFLTISPASSSRSSLPSPLLNASGRSRVLTVVLDGIEQLAATHGRPAAVVLDEFHQIILEGGDRAAHELRAAVASHRYTGYAFASSHLRLMDELTNRASCSPPGPRRCSRTRRHLTPRFPAVHPSRLGISGRSNRRTRPKTPPLRRYSIWPRMCRAMSSGSAAAAGMTSSSAAHRR